MGPQISVIKRLRQFVLLTSVGPLRRLYVFLYRLIAEKAARYVGQVEGVRSVYLRRGLAKGESCPGISDIDLAVITQSGAVQAQQQVWERYRRLKRWLPVLDESPDVLDFETLLANRRSTRCRYRLAEGRATWEPLVGADDRAKLPDAAIEQMESSAYFELRYWWALFNWQVLQSDAARHDPVLRNALCYKLVAEFLKIRMALEQRIVVFGRSEALQRCAEFLADDERPLVERLQRIAGARFLTRDEHLLDDVFAFLLRFVDRLHARLAANPHFSEPAAKGVRIDSPRGEWYWPADRQIYFDALLEQADHLLGGIRAAQPAKGVDFDLSDFAVLLEMEPGKTPTLEQVAQLGSRHLQRESPHAGRFHLYLLLEHCAVQIEVDHRRGNWDSTLRGVVSPLTNPDLFAAVGRDERLGGWTPAQQEITRDRRATAREALLDSSYVREWGCYSTFAKALQLDLWRDSAAEGDPLSAQTCPALLRALDARGKALPDWARTLLRPGSPGFEQANTDPAVARRAYEWLD